MPETQILTFTIDLKAFCDCPDNCPECCAPPCCSGISTTTTLHATWITGGFFCACASSDSIALTWDGLSKWTGTGPFGTCGQNLTLSVYCAGTDALGWRLDVSMSDTCIAAHTGFVPVSGNCSPFDINFGNLVGIDMTPCCTGPGPAALHVEVTT